MPEYSVEQLDRLRTKMSVLLSPERMKHVLAVEKMAMRIGLLFFWDDESLSILHAAALLHDNTKEFGKEEQLAILWYYTGEEPEGDLASPQTLHSFTGALVINDRYPEFADERVIDAVRYHTTGRAGMSLYEKIIFLADYIDDTRTYPACVHLRDEFFSARPVEMSSEKRLLHLDRTLLKAMDNTLVHLRAEGRTIHPATIEAYDDLKRRLGDEA